MVRGGKGRGGEGREGEGRGGEGRGGEGRGNLAMNIVGIDKYLVIPSLKKIQAILQDNRKIPRTH